MLFTCSFDYMLPNPIFVFNQQTDVHNALICEITTSCQSQKQAGNNRNVQYFHSAVNCIQAVYLVSTPVWTDPKHHSLRGRRARIKQQVW